MNKCVYCGDKIKDGSDVCFSCAIIVKTICEIGDVFKHQKFSKRSENFWIKQFKGLLMTSINF